MAKIHGITVLKEFKELYEIFESNEKGLELLSLTGISPDKIDIGKASKEFFEDDLANVSGDANSNITQIMDPTTYASHLMNGPMKLLGYHTLWYHCKNRYGLKRADELMMAIWDGRLYFHDAHGKKLQIPYCYAFSLQNMVIHGRPYGPSPNTPPKHRKSFISQVDKLIGDLSRQFAGAIAPSDFFLWYSHFCKKEGLDLNNKEDLQEILQDFQSLVCLFNEPSRSEGESPFVNIGIYDQQGLKNLFGHSFYPSGEKADLAYIMELQMHFCDWFKEQKDPKYNLPYRFPVVTLNATTEKKKFSDSMFLHWMAEVNSTGIFNIHFGDKSKLAMCCRYENDLEDMNMSSDSFGNGGVNIGSHRVVTINENRAALDAKMCNMDILEIVEERMQMCRELLTVHRKDILEKRIEKNPNYLKFFGSLKWFDMDTMFSTIGITAVNEMVETLGYDILDEDGWEVAYEVHAFMKEKIKEFRQEDGFVYNIEEIPGEQACVNMASKDRLIHGDKVKTNLYSNQYIPLTKDVTIAHRLELAGSLMKLVSGGGIVHINVGQYITPHASIELYRWAVACGVNHLAVCHRKGSCLGCGFSGNVGEETVDCPKCGDELTVTMNRVIGYNSYEANWNKTRRHQDARIRVFKNVEGENNAGK